jgi:hypothetical protein
LSYRRVIQSWSANVIRRKRSRPLWARSRSGNWISTCKEEKGNEISNIEYPISNMEIEIREKGKLSVRKRKVIYQND